MTNLISVRPEISKEIDGDMANRQYVKQLGAVEAGAIVMHNASHEDCNLEMRPKGVGREA